jgi:hypothetical protein
MDNLRNIPSSVLSYVEQGQNVNQKLQRDIREIKKNLPIIYSHKDDMKGILNVSNL